MKIDVEQLTNNLKEMASVTCKAEIALRPYYCGIPFVAKLQMEFGCIGSTVTKVEDIEVLMENGIFNYLYIGNLDHYDRLIELSLSSRILVVIEENTNIEALVESCKKYNQCIEVIVNYKLDDNYNSYLTYIQDIMKYEELDFAGLMCYSQEIADMPDFFERYDASYDVEEKLEKLINLLNEHDIQVDIVTGLSTATTMFRQEKYFDTHFTESQAGSYALGLKYDIENFTKAASELEDPKVYLVDNGEVIDEL